MALRASSDNAEDVAAGFATFRVPLPEHATEITALIADLYAISSSLKGLDDLTNDPVYRRNRPIVENDLELVRTSLKCTLDDIVEKFNEIKTQRGSDQEVYRRAWRRIDAHFQGEAGYSLSLRLGIYKRFLSQLDNRMREYVVSFRFSDFHQNGIQNPNVHTSLCETDSAPTSRSPTTCDETSSCCLSNKTKRGMHASRRPT